MKLVDDSRGPGQPIAVVVDVRSGSFFQSLYDYRHQQATGRPTTLVYLDAADEVLVRRQEASRRPHPLQGSGRLLHGLQAERVVLATLRGLADLVIDTSSLNVHQLTKRMREHFGSKEGTRLKTTVLSFGFKYGIPIDADYVADMRFLPNPHWIPELRPQTGQDAAGLRVRPFAAGSRGVPGRVPAPARPGGAGLRPRGQALHDDRGGLHGRQAPQCGDG